MAEVFPQETLLAQKTLFSSGAVLRLADEALEFGARGLIVHGSSFEKSGKKERLLSTFAAGAGTFCRRPGEPTIDDITHVIEKAKEMDACWIAGIGGGSALDLAKAAAGLYNAKENPAFYQEGGRLEKKGIPFIAVPTTAGTGSEATPNSVITNKAKKAKLSIRDKSFMARKVILDPELLRGMPSTVMSYAAMDAMVQAYESFISKNSTWFSETFALKALQLIDTNILPAYETAGGSGLPDLLLGSHLAGIALASARLGVIHGIAHPLGALYGLPHGLICSACFPPSIKLNKEAMGKKYGIISGAIGADLAERVEELLGRMNITSPFKGKELIDKEKTIEAVLTSGSTAANPKKIDREDAEFILGELF